MSNTAKVTMGPISSYTIEHHPHGMVVRGPMPLSDISGVGKIAEDRGYDLIATDLGPKLGASFVFVNKESHEAWRDEIKAGLPKVSRDASVKERAEAWREGLDTGVSSRAIYQQMRGQTQTAFHAPSDVYDFWRCENLLRQVPEWRERIAEMQAVQEDWHWATTENWERLAELLPAKGKPGKEHYHNFQKVFDEIKAPA